MSFSKKTVKDIGLKNKAVLVGVDYNVPGDARGAVTDTYRIKASLPTLKYLLQQSCKIILISHRGRPQGQPNKEFSLEPAAKELEKLVNQTVYFVDDCVGPKVKSRVESLRSKEILLLENTRFHKEEEANDPEFAKQLASLAEIFVQDAFGNAHRKHASTDGVTKHLPSVAGLLLEKEVSTITQAMENPKRPLVAVLGGAKVSDKLELLEHLFDKADFVAVGGAMANTFLKYQGYNIGKSVYEDGQEAKLEKIYEKLNIKAKAVAKDFTSLDDIFVVLPEFGPVAVAKKIDKNQRRSEVGIRKVEDDEYILDNDAHWIQDHIKEAGTIIWNGSVGMTEMDNFKKGSLELAQAITSSGAKSVVGGGDTAAFVVQEGLADKFDLVSTGGGASLQLMAGKKLPAVEALLDK